MIYCCCPLGLWNVDWSTGTIWSTGTPFLYVQYVQIYLLALIGLYLFCLLFVFQGATALSTFGGRFTDPELSRLASSLPLRCLGAKADSTTERYSRAFEKFRVWAASYKEISVLPTNVLHVLTSK